MTRLSSEETKPIRVPNELVGKVRNLMSIHRQKIKATKVSDRPDWYHRAVGYAKELGKDELEGMDVSTFYRKARKLYPKLSRWYGYQAYYDTVAYFTGKPSVASWTGKPEN